jgi:hypothetical protein
MTAAGRRALALLVEPWVPDLRPVRRLQVGVKGLSTGCGATTVARGLALELPDADVTDGVAPGPHGVLVAVADRTGVPVLAGLVTERLAERQAQVVLVVNRPDDPGEWERAGAVCLPQSRLAVMLVARGHRPWGGFGAALRKVAGAVRSI